MVVTITLYKRLAYATADQKVDDNPVTFKHFGHS